MRLIDADKLKQDDEVTLWLSRDTVRTGKMLKTFSELFIKKIDDAPTVQAIPFEILDKIKSEIEQITDTMGVSYNQYVSKIDVLKIIDRYKAEGSDEG